MAVRADRFEREREEQAAIAADAERRRIARELHDVIAHAVATMTVQAGGARLMLQTDPERAREPIETIEETGREALAEMRRMVGVLRAGDQTGGLAPQPGLRGVDRLVADLRADGHDVSFVTGGDPAVLSPGLDLTSYRLLEEAFDNVRAYAAGSAVGVGVWYGDGAVQLVVKNDAGDGPGRVSGRPLAALRERVELYGGTLEAGRLPEGGYRVVARLPIEPDR
jgi:signal transduction histidine kinase